MKKLQNNFTTPEQSKRLLEIGVPADSADCYLDVANNRRGMLAINGIYNMDVPTHVVREDGSPRFLPCWSVGRLMEIIAECYQVDMSFRYFVRVGMMESLINTFIELKEEIDFSKLEE